MGRKTFESLGRVCYQTEKHVILCNDAQMNIDDEKRRNTTRYKPIR